jgi:hypothetical protein
VKKNLGKIVSVLGLTALTAGLSAATAHDNDRHGRREIVRANLVGFNETPATLSTPASGTFWAEIDEDSGVIYFKLTYKDLTTSPPLFAHIHLGERHTTGGVMVFLCGGGPAANPKPACPAAPAEVTGSIMAADVIGPTTQGITAGQFEKVLDAIRSGAAYANVHTSTYPTGEIRGQVSR